MAVIIALLPPDEACGRLPVRGQGAALVGAELLCQRRARLGRGPGGQQAEGTALPSPGLRPAAPGSLRQDDGSGVPRPVLLPETPLDPDAPPPRARPPPP